MRLHSGWHAGVKYRGNQGVWINTRLLLVTMHQDWFNECDKFIFLLDKAVAWEMRLGIHRALSMIAEIVVHI